MAFRTATAGFPVYPKPYTATSRTPRARSEPKICSQRPSDQRTCLFLTRLAPEVRFIIYSHVFSVCPSKSYVKLYAAADETSHRPLPVDAIQQYIYRPPAGKRGYQSRDALALLRTCYSIYTEAQPLAVSTNTHVLLYPPSRALDFPIPRTAEAYFERMPADLVEHVKHLHLFVGANRLAAFHSETLELGGYPSESPFAELGRLRNGNGSAKLVNNESSCEGNLIKHTYHPIHPNTMTITVRDYEWNPRPGSFGNEQEIADRLLECRKWETVFGSLERLVIELEVDTELMEKLDIEARKLADFQFDVGDGRKLVCDTPYSVGHWIRTSGKGRKRVNGRGGAASGGFPKSLVVFVIQWNLVSGKDKQSKD